MTEKRYYVCKHLLQENKVHDKICHNFMNITETVEHMNMYYQKYTALKQENKQLKHRLFNLQHENRILKQDNQRMRIQRHEDINYLAKIGMEYKAINNIFKKALKEAKHSIEYETIIKIGKEIGVEFND